MLVPEPNGPTGPPGDIPIMVPAPEEPLEFLLPPGVKTPEEIRDEQLKSCGYTVIGKLGEGSYGAVFSIMVDDNPRLGARALKLVKIDTNDSPGIDDLREIDILSRLRHPNLLYTDRLVFPDKKCHLEGYGYVLPLADYNLLDFMTNGYLDIPIKLDLLFQISSAVYLMHRAGVLHLDIKLENVVIQGNEHHPHALLGDFSLVLYVDDLVKGRSYSTLLVTLPYRAPEILQGGRVYTAAVDVWALGILFLMLLSGDTLIFPDLTSDAMVAGYLIPRLESGRWYSRIDEILQGVGVRYFSDVSGLIKKMLDRDPVKRPKMGEILQAPLFQRYHQRPFIEGALVTPPQLSVVHPTGTEAWIRHLVFLFFTLYPTVQSETLFLAVDLVYRNTPLFISNPPVLVLTALWMSLKLIEVDRPTGRYLLKSLGEYTQGVNLETLLGTEIAVINSLQGVLYRPYLYHACQNSFQLRETLNRVVYNPEVYLVVNIPQWLRLIPNKEGSPSKEVTVKDLLTV